MTRNYGLSGQRSPRGQSTPLAATAPLRAPVPFPAGSYRSADEPFESLEIQPSLFEVARFICALSFLVAGGVSFFAFLFVIFCTDLL